MIERPPPELEALFDAERLASIPSAAVQNVVRAQIAATVGHAPLGAAAIGLALKLKLVLALAVVAGGAAGYTAITREHVADATIDVRANPAPVESVPEINVAPSTVVQHDAPAAPPVVSRVRVRERRPETLTAAAPAEASLLTRAWQSLSGNDAPGALALIAEAAKHYPQSTLDEERRALVVATLAALGRHEEEQRVAQDFLDKYPQSVHADRVRRSLTEVSQ